MDAPKDTYYADKVSGLLIILVVFLFLPPTCLFLRVCLFRGMLGESGMNRVNMNFLYCLEEFFESPSKENLGDLLCKVTRIFQKKWANLNDPTCFFSLASLSTIFHVSRKYDSRTKGSLISLLEITFKRKNKMKTERNFLSSMCLVRKQIF